MKVRGIVLERAAGTGGQGAKKPDFCHQHPFDLYCEVKVLEIADPLQHHKDIDHEALEIAAELDGRARSPASISADRR